MVNKSELFEQISGHIEESATLNPDARENANRRRDFADGDQYSSHELSVFAKRKEPALTDNVIKDKVDTTVGIEVKLRTDPKAYPRNPGDDDKADVATKSLRYTADNSGLPSKFTKCLRQLNIEGTEIMFVGVSKKKGDRRVIQDEEGNPQTVIVNNDIDPRPIMFDRAILDPRAREEDYSDARYFGEVRWLDLKDFQKENPKHSEDALDLFKFNIMDTFKDQPDCWIDKSHGKRVMTFQLYYLNDGQWWYCEGFKSNFIKEPVPSKYLDEHGEPTLPYIVQSSWVKRDGERQGEVERYMDPQRNINKRLSKSLHLLNKNQIVAEKGAVDGNLRQIKAEAKKPDGVMIINPGQNGRRFEIRDNMDLSRGHLEQLQVALNRFENTGPNAALQGQENASGRSLQIQQEAGSSKLGPVFDAHDQFKTRVYRAVWERQKQFWTQEKWIRITEESDDTEAAQFEPINQPIGVDENGQPVLKNALAEIDVEIIIDDAPDVVNLQSEQFDNLISLSNSRYGDQIPLKLIIEASQFANKRKLLEMLDGGGDELSEEEQQARQQQAEQQQQMQQMLEELAIKTQQLEAALLEAQVADKQAQAEQREADTAKTELEMIQTLQAPQQI